MSPQEFDPEAEYHYPARDFLCLSCVVPGGCKPYAALCLWRADQSEDPLRRREVQLLLEAGRRQWRSQSDEVVDAL